MNLRITRGLLATVVLAAASAAQAAAFSSLIVFGDSLSDSGNNALALGTDPGQVITGNSYIPTFPYASGTYSDGDVWATTFASSLGLTLTPSLTGGTNYAYGGAVTGPQTGPFPPGLRDQVGSFISDVGGSAAADALYVIAGGGNNARAALEAISTGAPLLSTVVSTAVRYAYDVGLMVDQLQAAGAQDIVVWNAPNLAYAPAVAAEGSAATFLGQVVARAMNRALAKRLQSEAGVTTFDLYGLLGMVAVDPESFGFDNATDACGAIFGCDPATSLFWDGIHPTSGGHQLIAEAMFAAVVPEPGVLWMFAAGLGVLLVKRRRAA